VVLEAAPCPCRRARTLYTNSTNIHATMAKEGHKRRVEENRKKLRLYLIAGLVSTVRSLPSSNSAVGKGLKGHLCCKLHAHSDRKIPSYYAPLQCSFFKSAAQTQTIQKLAHRHGDTLTVSRAVQVLHITFRYILRFRSVGIWVVIGSTTCITFLAAAYRVLDKATEATLSADNALIDGGADLSKPSATMSMAKDLLWVCVILLPVVGATNYGWWLALVVLGAGAWQGYKLFLAPMLSIRGGRQEAAGLRNGRREKRSERRRIKKF
jgi:hypothetical protein